MKKYAMAVLAVFFVLPAVQGTASQERNYAVEIAAIPADVDAFTVMRDRVATTPEGGVAMLLVALKMYEADQAEGLKALIMIMHMDLLVQQSGARSYKGYAMGMSYPYMLNSVTSRFPYFASSYFPGTSPGQSYRMGRGPYSFVFTPHRHRPQNDTEHTLFVPCSGADSPRPVQVKKNDKGIWKAANFSSLLVGIRAAASAAPRDEL